MATSDEVRTELVRARGFNSGSETEATKGLTKLDAGDTEGARVDFVRSRGKIRASDTQIRKTLALFDALGGVVDPPVEEPPVVEPPEDPADPTPEPPAMPATITVERGDEDVRVSWSSVPGATYRLTAGGNDGSWHEQSEASGTEATFPAPTAGWVCVAAVVGDAEGEARCTQIPAPGVVEPEPTPEPEPEPEPTPEPSGDFFEETWDYPSWPARECSSSYAASNDPNAPRCPGNVGFLRGSHSLERGTLIDGSTGNFVRTRYAGNAVESYTGIDLVIPPEFRAPEIFVEIEARFDAGWRDGCSVGSTPCDHKFVFLLPSAGGRWGFCPRNQNGKWDWWGDIANNPDLVRFNYPDGPLNPHTDFWNGKWGVLKIHASPTIRRVLWNDHRVTDNRNLVTNMPADAVFQAIALGRNADPTGVPVLDWGRVRVSKSGFGW